MKSLPSIDTSFDFQRWWGSCIAGRHIRQKKSLVTYLAAARALLQDDRWIGERELGDNR